MWARFQYDRWNEEVRAASERHQQEGEKIRTDMNGVNTEQNHPERKEPEENKENEGGIREDYKTLMIINNTMY